VVVIHFCVTPLSGQATRHSKFESLQVLVEQRFQPCSAAIQHLPPVSSLILSILTYLWHANGRQGQCVRVCTCEKTVCWSV